MTEGPDSPVFITKEQAAGHAASWVYRRRLIERDLKEFYKEIYGPLGLTAAAHHNLLMDKLQAVTDGTLVHSQTGDPCRNLIFLLPPGSAKSWLSSILFPAWALKRRPRSMFLAASCTADLGKKFSGDCRNLIDANQTLLEYGLRDDKRGVEEWATTNGGEYKTLGVGASISGRRFDFGIVDDYVANQEDADSQTQRDKIWFWWLGDFVQRGKGGGQTVKIIVANRRHEDDLVGRILAQEESKWELVKVPFFAKENDALGRPVGASLWPEYFTQDKIDEANTLAKISPRIFSGLLQQEPAPEEGSYFLREWMRGYTQEEYDALMRRKPRIYGAGDWAVSEEDDANRTCLGGVAVDEDKTLWVLPDLHWKISGPKETCGAFVDFLKRREPMAFRSEKGHISKAWGPFLRDMMMQQDVYAHIDEYTPSKAKDVRARSIQGLMSMGRVRFPTFAGWWPDAMHEMLMFPGGKTDDFVDFLAHVGALVYDMLKLHKPAEPRPKEDLNIHVPITLEWIKKSHRDRQQALRPKYGGR